MTLALPPPELTPAATPQPGRLLLPAPTADRQLHLRPEYVFAELDHPRAMVEAEPSEETGSSTVRARRQLRVDAAFQLDMPLPSTPKGKGRSLGTNPLSRAERAEKAAAIAAAGAETDPRRLRVLPETRRDCLAFRAVLPPKGAKLPKGDRGRRLAPCPFVSCRHHLYLDVNPESGAIKVNFPGLERWELAEPWPAVPRMVTLEHGSRAAPGRRERLTFYGPPRQHMTLDLSSLEDTCSLDVGDRGDRRGQEFRRRKVDLAVVGRKMNLTMERARQLLEHAQGEAMAKATDGQVMRPLEGDDPNDGSGDDGS